MGERILFLFIAGVVGFIWVWGYRFFDGPEAQAVYLLASLMAVARLKKCRHAIEAGEGGASS